VSSPSHAAVSFPDSVLDAVLTSSSESPLSSSSLGVQLSAGYQQQQQYGIIGICAINMCLMGGELLPASLHAGHVLAFLLQPRQACILHRLLQRPGKLKQQSILWCQLQGCTYKIVGWCAFC
jgi:hypothetical protein